ncbi:MAG: EAL domain-containing protein [Pseudomonadota bacterium]|nr:EAL domain-containing protein [Pseudomonadota bacterium]
MSFNLRKKILVPLILVFLGLALAFIAVYQHEQQHKLNALKQLTLASVDAYYHSSISARTQKLEVLADEMVSDPVIVRELKGQNRAALLAATQTRYKIYNTVGDVTHLYFHALDGTNLLRVHQPEKHGDLIDRFTLKQAMKEGKSSAGVELGVLGTLTLRVVTPVFQAGVLVGYIELGEEIGDIYQNIISALGIDLYLFIDESLLSSAELPSFIDSRVIRDVVPQQVLYQFNHDELPAYLLKALATGLDAPEILIQFTSQAAHLLGELPLVNASGRTIGRLVIDKDVTELVATSQRSVAWLSVALLLLWGVVCVALYRVLGRFERRLNGSVEALQEKETALVNVQHIARLSGWELNLTTQMFSCSAEFCELLAITVAQAPATLDELTVYVHPDERQLFRDYVDAVVAQQVCDDLLHRFITAEGAEVWVNLVAARICTVAHRYETIQAVVQDVTETHGADMQATKLGSLLKYSWDEIYLFHDETLTFVEVSEGALRNLGYSLTEMQCMTVDAIKPEIDHNVFEEMVQHLRRGLVEQEVFETTHQRKDGSRYPVEVRLQYCHDVAPPLFMAVVQDISERQRYIAELERKALYDELTGLPNRALLCDRLGEWVKQARRNHTVFAVLVLEISLIKEIDDVLGYETGDELIKQVATRMVDNLRQSDVVGHLGVGVFALLLSLDEAEKIRLLIAKLIRLVQMPVVIGDVAVDIDVSIGATLHPSHGDEPNVLLRHADMALQHAKAELLSHMIYEDGSHPFSLRRLQLIAELRQAIMNDQLVLHYQPKVNVATGMVESVEALVRWPLGQESQWVGPAEFIPLAEQTGLIYPLTALVLRQAVNQCRLWLAMGINIKVAVNLSARNLLDPTLTEAINAILTDNGVPASNITLEVTESMMMRQPERALEVLNQLHGRGMGVSIDDYGTGYSSLAYLKQLPVHELKIDQSFIRNMLINKDDAIIVRSTIELAHNLGLRVVAEGVEDYATWTMLDSLGCDLIQGYFASRPASAADFEAWYQRNGARFIPG